MKIDLLQFNDYRSYLKQEFPSIGAERGNRSELAKSMDCQTSYLSQVMTDRSHLSLEQAIKVSHFLSHSPEERKYFLLLVQYNRAEGIALKDHFYDEILEEKKKRNEIRQRIGIKSELTAKDQMKYYSTWHYSAIHVLTAFDEFNTAEAIAVRLKLSITQVKNALQFLVKRGFVIRGQYGFKMGQTRIHLAKGSEMLPRHHANWRMKAIDSADLEADSDLHYTAVLGLSRKDARRFKNELLQLIQNFEIILRESKVEVPKILLLDFFGV